MPGACNRALSCVAALRQKALLGVGQNGSPISKSKSNGWYLEDQKDDGEGSTQASDTEVGPGIRAHG